MWWIFNGVGVFLFWYLTDLRSESTFYSTVCPLLVAWFVISLMVQVVIAIGPGGGSGRGGGHGGDGGSWGGFGDGGGCDGGDC